MTSTAKAATKTKSTPIPGAALINSKETFESLLKSLGIDNRLTASIKKLGFEYPTLVQSQCLPLSIEKGRDILVQARTGSGKTLAYAIPILHKILSSSRSSSLESSSNSSKKDFVKAIVLVPTRELCHQVHAIFAKLCQYCDDIIQIGVLLSSSMNKEGSDDVTKQEAMLRDAPPILISTPASLLRHIKQNTLDLRTSVEMVVLDEADLILSFGYKEDVDEIIKNLPKIYQGFLMSATLASGRKEDVEELGRLVLHNPLTLKLEEEKRSENLMQYYLEVPKLDKNMVLYVFIKLGVLKGKGLFFVNGIDAGYRLKLFWEQFHISSAVLNADLPLASRLSIIEQFNAGLFDYLIATDDSTADASQKKKAASSKSKSKKKKNDSEFGVSRGLDFHHVAFVVNVDFPLNVESYIHRIGRTARANQRGTALTLLEKDNLVQSDLLSIIQATQPSLPLPKGEDVLLPEAGGNHLASNNALPQPSPLNFDLKDIEGFRYRVEDVRRAVTKSVLRETKIGELKAEILNSDRLQSYFMENKADLKYLQHNRKVLHASKVQNHLKRVPEYILPRGMEAVEIKKRKRKHVKKQSTTQKQRKREDPLQSYESVTLDDILDAEEDGIEDEPVDDDVPMQELPVEQKPSAFGTYGKGKGSSSFKSSRGKGRSKR